MLAAQKSVKKLSVDRAKSELAVLKDEKAAERKLIKKYEKHMQKSKEKVEKVIQSKRRNRGRRRRRPRKPPWNDVEFETETLLGTARIISFIENTEMLY